MPEIPEETNKIVGGEPSWLLPRIANAGNGCVGKLEPRNYPHAMAEGLSAAKAEHLLREWTANESLVKHGLAVAACTESYGKREVERLGLQGGEAEALAEKYRSTGLLHDFDYDRHPTPEEHPFVGVAYLREHGWPEDILHAILAHADYSGVKPDTHLDRTLFACDELAGFLTACALVKPSKAIADVEVAGVRKKMKDKGFARAVKREDITHGAGF